MWTASCRSLKRPARSPYGGVLTLPQTLRCVQGDLPFAWGGGRAGRFQLRSDGRRQDPGRVRGEQGEKARKELAQIPCPGRLHSSGRADYGAAGFAVREQDGDAGGAQPAQFGIAAAPGVVEKKDMPAEENGADAAMPYSLELPEPEEAVMLRVSGAAQTQTDDPERIAEFAKLLSFESDASPGGGLRRSDLPCQPRI